MGKIVKPKKLTRMEKLIAILKEKKEKIIHHEGIIKIENKRIFDKLKESVIAKAHPTEFIKGSGYIKQILLLKQNNTMRYSTGKLAAYVFKKIPELNTPEVVKCILIATGNPIFTSESVNKMVAEIFDSEIPKAKRKTIIFTLIRSISKKNHGYLLD